MGRSGCIGVVACLVSAGCLGSPPGALDAAGDASSSPDSAVVDTSKDPGDGSPTSDTDLGARQDVPSTRVCCAESDARLNVNLHPAQTYLANDNNCADRPSPAIDLAGGGICEGDVVQIWYVGDFNLNPGTAADRNDMAIGAVFSGTDVILERDASPRLPDAIGVTTVISGAEPFDAGDGADSIVAIEEDFAVRHADEQPLTEVEVPPGGRFLFAAVRDPYYCDNEDGTVEASDEPEDDFGIVIDCAGE